MSTPGVPNIQLYFNGDAELCIARTRRQGEESQLIVTVSLDDLLAGGRKAAGERLGGALLQHLALLYPDVIPTLEVPIE